MYAFPTKNGIGYFAILPCKGITRDKPRWQKCVELTNEEMGMAVGAMFIRENFKKESKDTVSSLSKRKYNLLAFFSIWIVIIEKIKYLELTLN